MHGQLTSEPGPTVCRPTSSDQAPISRALSSSRLGSSSMPLSARTPHSRRFFSAHDGQAHPNASPGVHRRLHRLSADTESAGSRAEALASGYCMLESRESCRFQEQRVHLVELPSWATGCVRGSERRCRVKTTAGDTVPPEPLGPHGNRVSREACRSDLLRLAIRTRSTTRKTREQKDWEKPDQQQTPTPAIAPPKVRCAAATHAPSSRLAIL